MKTFFCRSLSFGTIACLLLTACSHDSDNARKKPLRKCGCKEQSITINIVKEPETLDPRKAYSLGDVNVAKMFGEGLTRLGKRGTTELALAEKVIVSEDQKTYTFSLRNALWSNGDKITASDFVHAWKTALHPKFIAENAPLLFGIKNAKNIKEGSLPVSFLEVYAPSDNTLVIVLEKEIPYFLELVSSPIFFPISKQCDKTVPQWSESAETFVSNGPFTLLSWEHQNAIVAIKNPRYWDAKNVSLENIQMIMVDEAQGSEMLAQGEIHWEGFPFCNISADTLIHVSGNNRVQFDPLLGTYWIQVNNATFPNCSEEIRQALSLAIDRNVVMQNVLEEGDAHTPGIFPVSFTTDGKNLQKKNVLEAANTLKAALANENKTIEDLPEMILTYVGDQANHRIAQAVQTQWQKHLGIKVRLEPLETDQYMHKIVNDDYQLACGSWVADFNHPIHFLDAFKAKHLRSDLAQWESLNYLEALKSSYLCEDAEAKQEQIEQAEQLLTERAPVVPIFHYSLSQVKNPFLQDVVLSRSGVVDFKWAYLVQELPGA